MENMSVDTFIEKFAANVWAMEVEARGTTLPALDAFKSFLGFIAAFQAIFDRKPTKLEIDHLKLNFLEREHKWLLARGKDGIGFNYPVWHPGGDQLLKLRYRLGVPGGVKNNAEWQKAMDNARNEFYSRRKAA